MLKSLKSVINLMKTWRLGTRALLLNVNKFKGNSMKQWMKFMAMETMDTNTTSIIIEVMEITMPRTLTTSMRSSSGSSNITTRRRKQPLMLRLQDSRTTLTLGLLPSETPLKHSTQRLVLLLLHSVMRPKTSFRLLALLFLKITAILRASSLRISKT